MNLDETGANENMDMPAHVKTYETFMSFAKVAIVFLVVLLLFMFFFLA